MDPIKYRSDILAMQQFLVAKTLMGISGASVLELAAFIEEFGELLTAAAAGRPPPPRDKDLPTASTVANSPLEAIRAMRNWLTDDVCQMEETDLKLGFDFCLKAMQNIVRESTRRQKVEKSANRTSVRRASRTEDKARKEAEDKQRKEAERVARKDSQARAQAAREAQERAERDAKEKAELETKAEEEREESTRAARSAESLRRRQTLNADRAKFQQEHLSKKPSAREHTEQEAHVSAIMTKYSQAKPAPAITSYKRGSPATGSACMARSSVADNTGGSGGAKQVADAIEGEKELAAKADREAASNAKQAAIDKAKAEEDAATAQTKAEEDAAIADAKAEDDAATADAKAAKEKDARSKREAAEKTAPDDKQEAAQPIPEPQEAQKPNLVKLDRVDHSKWQSEQERLAASVNVGAAVARASELDFSFNFG